MVSVKGLLEVPCCRVRRILGASWMRKCRVCLQPQVSGGSEDVKGVLVCSGALGHWGVQPEQASSRGLPQWGQGDQRAFLAASHLCAINSSTPILLFMFAFAYFFCWMKSLDELFLFLFHFYRSKIFVEYVHIIFDWIHDCEYLLSKYCEYLLWT